MTSLASCDSPQRFLLELDSVGGKPMFAYEYVVKVYVHNLTPLWKEKQSLHQIHCTPP